MDQLPNLNLQARSLFDNFASDAGSTVAMLCKCRREAESVTHILWGGVENGLQIVVVRLVIGMQRLVKCLDAKG